MCIRDRTNTFNIVLAVFDVSQHVIQQSAGIIQNGTEITPDVLDSLRTELEAMELEMCIRDRASATLQGAGKRDCPPLR